jgi:hypothetical protein
LTKKSTFLASIPLGYDAPFFDKVLTNKTVDYVIDHLAAANFDPEFFTSYEKRNSETIY